MKGFKTWWYFHIMNPVIRSGESGGFKWVFRRFTLDITTVSGNWSVRFTAAEHPYAYLLAGKNDDNIIGFCQMLYYLGMVITTDQGLVNDVQKAFKKYEKRMDKQAAGEVKEEELEEELALEEVAAIQEYTEMSDVERKKRDRDVNGRFKKAVKKVESQE